MKKIAISRLGEKNLIKKLIKKHEEKLKELKIKREIISRILILRDKIDQISYWLSSSEMTKGKNIKSELKKAREDLKKEIKNYEKIFKTKFSEAKNLEKEKLELERSIERHEAAMKYWKERNGK